MRCVAVFWFVDGCYRCLGVVGLEVWLVLVYLSLPLCVFCECCELWVFSGCVFLNWLLDAGVGVVWLVIWWWFAVLDCIGCRLCLELFWVAVEFGLWVIY